MTSNPYYSFPSSPISIPPISPQLDTLPPPSPTHSTRIAIILENEKLRKKNQELLISLSMAEFETEQMRKKLVQVQEELTNYRFYQIAANSHFEMFLKDMTCLSERYRIKAISQLKDKIIEISSEHEL